MYMMSIMMCSTPPKTRISRKTVRRCVDHARLICTNFENTSPCHEARLSAQRVVIEYINECEVYNDIVGIQWADEIVAETKLFTTF
jgi:hypothetical protein